MATSGRRSDIHWSLIAEDMRKTIFPGDSMDTRIHKYKSIEGKEQV